MIVAVVPTKNERDSIRFLVSQLRHVVGRVIVADASTDDTAERAANAGAQVVFADRGLRGAYLRAWEECSPDDVVVHIDAGGSHSIEAVRALIDVYDRTDCDMVISTRFDLGGTHIGNWWRKFTSRLAAWACNVATVRDFSDWTSGLRLYSPEARKVLSEYEWTTDFHAWQIESLYCAVREGLEIKEAPIHYVAGKSALNRQRVLEAARLWWGMLWSF